MSISQTQSDWAREYDNAFSHIPTICPKCKTESPRIRVEYDVEQHHPVNKLLTKQQLERGEGHTTEFQRCDMEINGRKCNRILYLDGKPIG